MPITAKREGATLGSNTFSGDQTISSSSLTPLNVASTDAGAALGPIVDVFRNSASPAASDIIGGANFTGNSSTGAKRTFSSIQTSIVTATNAAEDGSLKFYTMKAGTLTLAATIDQAGAVTFAGIPQWPAITATGGGLQLTGGLVTGGGGGITITGGIGLNQATAGQITCISTGQIGFSANTTISGANDTYGSRITAGQYGFNGSVSTAAPAGASAGAWKLGSVVAGAVILDTTRSAFVDIGGSVIKVMIAQ